MKLSSAIAFAVLATSGMAVTLHRKDCFYEDMCARIKAEGPYFNCEISGDNFCQDYAQSISEQLYQQAAALTNDADRAVADRKIALAAELDRLQWPSDHRPQVGPTSPARGP